MTARLWHLALAREWSAAAAGGGYATSTLGRTLDEEGFTHCAHLHQVEGVARRFYAGVADPLVLLEIDPTRLASEVVEEVPPGAPEAFPHVYGPIDVAAVVAVHPLERGADGTLALPAGLSGSRWSGPSS